MKKIIKRLKLYFKGITLEIDPIKWRFIEKDGLSYDMDGTVGLYLNTRNLNKSCTESVFISTKKFKNSTCIRMIQKNCVWVIYNTEDEQRLDFCLTGMEDVFGCIPKKFYFKFC